MVRLHNDGSLEDEELVREGGVFVSRNGGREIEGDAGAADDFIEDQGTGDGVPGTVDDLPYDFGLETAVAADAILASEDTGEAVRAGVGATRADDDSEPTELGDPEERELWSQQRGLLEESADEDARYAGLSDDEIARFEAASGEDAAEDLPDAPGGTSATGAE